MGRRIVKVPIWAWLIVLLLAAILVLQVLNPREFEPY
jgi:hypothetical protein